MKTKATKKVQRMSGASRILIKSNRVPCSMMVFKALSWPVVDSETADTHTYLATGPVGNKIGFTG